MNTTGTLDGSVQSQGIHIGFRDWLDMGSQGWKDTPDKTKAYAYQAAMVCGWTDSGLVAIMLQEFAPRIDEDMADFTLNLLKEMVAEYPCETVQVREAKIDKPIFRQR